MPLVRLSLRRGVALAFGRADVEEDRAVGIAGDCQGAEKRFEVVAVDWADVAEAERFDESVADEESL